MKYNKVVRGGQLSASQWNGFLDLHREYYGGNANNGPIPPILSKSVIASASLADGSDEIGAYQPVRIVQQVSLDGGTLSLPAYIVEAVDMEDGERHGNYAFTLGEGLTSEGGRVVVSGLALVAMDASQLQKDKADQAKEGSFDSSFYVVPDETLSPDVDNYIAPTGHFKLLSWYTAQSANDISSSDTAFVVINMNDRPTSFLATVDATIDASTEDAGTTTMSSGAAYAFYTLENDETAGTIGVVKDDTAYEITVYNPLGEDVPAGDVLITYSLEYNRFLALPASAEPAGTIFAVELTKDGGAAGTALAATSWTYTISRFEGSGETYGTEEDIVSAPHHYKRPSLGQMTEATFGLGQLNEAGDFVLLSCNEVMIFDTCD